VGQSLGTTIAAMLIGWISIIVLSLLAPLPVPPLTLVLLGVPLMALFAIASHLVAYWLARGDDEFLMNFLRQTLEVEER